MNRDSSVEIASADSLAALFDCMSFTNGLVLSTAYV